MAFLHIKKSLKDYDCSLECVRHYALVNDLKIRDLTHLVVSRISSSQLQILLKQKRNQITLFYIPLHADFPYEIEQQPTLSELRTNSPTVLLCLGSIIRRVPISSLTGQMLHTMEHNSKRCCMCWDEIQITTEAELNNACSGCNVIWCTPCHSKFEDQLWKEFIQGAPEPLLRCPNCRLSFVTTSKEIIVSRVNEMMTHVQQL